MKVEIKSKKTITPSTPTPQHLRNFQISAIDQISSPLYVPIIFYYTAPATANGDPTTETAERNTHLEKSLSETLTVFYPLAGRYLHEDFKIDCGDQGVDYFEARVDGELAQIVHGDPATEELNRFVPFVAESAVNPLVAIQINEFECGGLAVGIRFSHRVVDGVTMVAFVNGWATASRVGIGEVVRPEFHLALVFPPDKRSGRFMPAAPRKMAANKIVTRKFVFDGAAISTMKEAAKGGGATERPASRVEVVTGVVWKALIRVAETKNGKLRGYVIGHAVNMRGKTVINPPLTESSWGNLNTLAIARFAGDKNKMELHDLVGLVRDATRSAIDECGKAQNGEELLLKVTESLREFGEEFNKEEVDVLVFTSWCRFPVYEADFGWGKPCWVSKVHDVPVELIMLIDTKSGGGIEAWVSLDEKDMVVFQQDEDIVAFASLPK